MNELPVFISYRRDDGTPFAEWLHKSLHRQNILVRRASLDLYEIISVYLDREMPAVPNWQDHLRQALELAGAFIVICTPGAKFEFKDKSDWFYYEIRWWLENRSTIAPILLAPSGPSWVPDIIHERWPDVQLIDIDASGGSVKAAARKRTIRRIFKSIALSAGQEAGANGVTNDTPRGDISMPLPARLYMWEKDTHFRYTNCNENYARSAGYDSPRALIGKTDDDMPWRPWADFFRAGDQQVFSGTGSARVNIQEKEMMLDRVADILVTEDPLCLNGECVGLMGYYLDITGQTLAPRPAATIDNGKGICLGPEFGGEYFSEEEAGVFKGIVKNDPRPTIASSLQMSRAAVDAHIQSIKRKLQCVTDADVIATAIRSGLPLTLFGPERF